MSKNYLTPMMIQAVLAHASSPIWQMGILASLKQNWFDILSVSPAGLIFIHGNQDTGWAHIMSRHSYYSDELYFGAGALGNPSRFNSREVPIFDWSKIADDIFLQGNIDTKEHPDAHRFTKMIGRSSSFSGSQDIEKDFILILYRNTPIVHSLFPKKSLQSDLPTSKLLDFKRHLKGVKAKKYLFGNTLTLFIPYLDKYQIERYQIIIQINLKTMLAFSHLQVNNNKGTPMYCHYNLLEFDFNGELAATIQNESKLPHFINSFCRYADFQDIEELMIAVETRLFAKT